MEALHKCKHCSHFDLAQKKEPFGVGGEVAFLCPAIADFFFSDTLAECKQFVPIGADVYRGSVFNSTMVFNRR